MGCPKLAYSLEKVCVLRCVWNREKESKTRVNLYDYHTRFYDPQIGRWHVVDPLTEKYPSVSPYVYCINNPLIFVDSDGREVKPTSAVAYNIIARGVTPQEAKYLRLDANGYIDKSYLRQGLTNLGTVGGNYSSLLRLAEDKQIIEVYTQNKFETSLGEKDMGQPTFESTLDVMYGIEGGGKSKEEYAASHPNYSADKEWSGWFGVALFPDEAGGQGSTLSGNIQIYVNSNAQNADKKQGYKKMTSTFAHEAYGHVLYKLLGLPHSHGSKKSLTSDSPDNNKALENQIYNRENEADKNFDLQFK